MFFKIILLVFIINLKIFSSDLENVLSSEYAEFDLSSYDKIDKDTIGKKISTYQDIKKINYDLPYKLRFEDFNPMNYLIILKLEKDVKSSNEFLKENEILDVAFAYQFTIYKEKKIKVVYGYYKELKHAKEDLEKLKKNIKNLDGFKPYITRVALSQLEYYKFKVHHK